MSRFFAVMILATFVVLVRGGAVDDTRQAPRAVIAWAAGPMEARVAFDRPIEEAEARGLVGKSASFQATNVTEGPIGPTADKPSDSTGSLRIAATRLEDEGRTLVLLTDPIPWEATYRLSLDGLGRGTDGKAREMKFDLSGVEVSWTSEGHDSPDWSGWWPHVEPGAVQDLARDSAEHERALGLLSKPGRLAARSLIALPKGNVLLRLESNGTIEEAVLNYEPGTIGEDAHQAELAIESSGEPVEFDLTIRRGGDGPPLSLRATYRVGEDPTEHSLPASRFILPWAPLPPPSPRPVAALPATLAGGDPERGKQVFFGEESRCSACHQYRGQGGTVGPDLSNLSQRDRAWIYQEIAEPSALIDPDYVSFTAVLRDGRVLSGIIRGVDDQTIRVVDADARETRVQRSEVEELRPSATSIMPVGLAGALGEQALRDLLAFLTAKAP